MVAASSISISLSAQLIKHTQWLHVTPLSRTKYCSDNAKSSVVVLSTPWKSGGPPVAHPHEVRAPGPPRAAAVACSRCLLAHT